MSDTGHFIYECKGSRPYLTRPSRTQQLENPKLLAKLKADGKPSVEVPEEFKRPCVLCFDIQASHPLIVHSAGTANRILEAKEKNASKEDKGKGKAKEGETSRKSKRARRYATKFLSNLNTVYLIPLPRIAPTRVQI